MAQSNSTPKMITRFVRNVSTANRTKLLYVAAQLVGLQRVRILSNRQERVRHELTLDEESLSNSQLKKVIYTFIKENVNEINKSYCKPGILEWECVMFAFESFSYKPVNFGKLKSWIIEQPSISGGLQWNGDIDGFVADQPSHSKQMELKLLENSGNDLLEQMMIIGRRRFQEMIDALGGVYSLDQVVKLTGWSEDEVLYNVDQRNVLAYFDKGSLLFPVVQFKNNRTVLGLSELANLLPSDISDLAVIIFFLTPIGSGGKFLSPMERLHSGDSNLIELARREARIYLEQVAT